MNDGVARIAEGISDNNDNYIVPTEIAKVILDAASYADDEVIYPAFRWLQKNQPLGVAVVEGYDPVWLVTKHVDIMEIERNPDLYRSGDANPILNSQAEDKFTRSINNGSLRTLSSLTYMDPPEHSLYRKITANWFLPGNIRKLEGQIRESAQESVRRLMSFDKECDFVKDFALYYPLRVIMTLFGVPPEDEPYMLRLTQDLFGTKDPEEQRDDIKLEPDVAARQWNATLQDFYAYFNVLSTERRKKPTDDLLSLIANSKVDGDVIGEDEANGYYVAIAAAGHDTTSSSVAGGMLGLIKFPSEFSKAKESPSLIGGLVDEAIRWVSPVKHFMRSASAATELRGRPIKAMDRLMLCYPAANRDEEIFDTPDKFQIERKPNRHIGFGYGPHVCLGQHLAKLEMRILFEELLPKLKSIELNGTPRATAATFVSGLKSLPVRFEKA